jgi:DNA-binding MarR family transcriptional regulator
MDGDGPGSMVLLTRLAKVVFRRTPEELIGMRLRLFVTLVYLRDHDGATQQELGEAMCMDANNLVLLLNELESDGCVRRLRDPDDRRRHLVELTDGGRRALERGERAMESVEDDVLGALADDERETLRALLARALAGASEAPAPVA